MLAVSSICTSETQLVWITKDSNVVIGSNPCLLLPDINGQKLDSFASHSIQHYNNNTSRTYLRKCMTFKVLKQLNPIGAMKIFTKPNCNQCMQEHLTILKILCDKRVTVINKNSEIYGACQHKTIFRQFCLSTDDPVFNGWRG